MAKIETPKSQGYILITVIFLSNYIHRNALSTMRNTTYPCNIIWYLILICFEINHESNGIAYNLPIQTYEFPSSICHNMTYSTHLEHAGPNPGY